MVSQNTIFYDLNLQIRERRRRCPYVELLSATDDNIAHRLSRALADVPGMKRKDFKTVLIGTSVCRRMSATC